MEIFILILAMAILAGPAVWVLGSRKPTWAFSKEEPPPLIVVPEMSMGRLNQKLQRERLAASIGQLQPQFYLPLSNGDLIGPALFFRQTDETVSCGSEGSLSAPVKSATVSEREVVQSPALTEYVPAEFGSGHGTSATTSAALGGE